DLARTKRAGGLRSPASDLHLAGAVRIVASPMTPATSRKAEGNPAATARGGRVLILSVYYAPEITGNAPLVTELARGLAARGLSVRVVAGTPHYRLAEVPTPYRRRLYLREMVDGVEATRCFAVPARNSPASKILNYASFLITSLPACLAGPKPDWVLVITPPFLLGMAGAAVKFVRGAKLAYNAQDIFPRAYVAGEMLRKGWLVRVLAGVQRWVYRRADVVTTITPAMADELAADGVSRARLRVIPNFADEEALRPLPRDNDFSRQHALTGKFVVLYAGNIGTLHGAEVLAPVAKHLEAHPDILVLVVGEGTARAQLEQAVAAAGVRNLKMLPPQPNDALAAMLASADIGVVTTRAGTGRTSFPSRLYGLMAAARPIVAAVDEDSDAAALLRTANCGLVTPPGDAEALTRAILQLRNQAEERRALGQAGRSYLERSLTKRSVVEKYAELFSGRAGDE
ncbi:MAG: glycosyltransferase family 4 protein, partial [Candidatus Acidiferrales bacterium]